MYLSVFLIDIYLTEMPPGKWISLLMPDAKLGYGAEVREFHLVCEGMITDLEYSQCGTW